MSEVAQRFADDNDVRTFAVEALMNVNSWKLWTPAGEPAAGRLEIVAHLEAALARDPQHAGANDYYIHAIEASKQPEKRCRPRSACRSSCPAQGARSPSSHASPALAHRVRPRRGWQECRLQLQRVESLGTKAWTGIGRNP